MSVIDRREILSIFAALNASPVEYILIRNINAELPDALRRGKDIDLLVRRAQQPQVMEFFERQQYREIDHPHHADTYLYGVDKFSMVLNEQNGLSFDLHWQLACRSLNAGEWIPLDQSIQTSAWQRRHRVSERGLAYWALSHEDEFVALMARSMFDKRAFEEGYVNRIGRLFTLIDREAVGKKLERVFFKYAPHVLRGVADGAYERVLNEHLKFTGY